jgi:hypothetical protein
MLTPTVQRCREINEMLACMSDEKTRLYALAGLEVGPAVDIISYLPPEFQLNIRKVGFVTKSYVCLATDTVGTLKEICQEDNKVPVEQLHFYYDNKLVLDHKVLTETGAHSGSMFQLEIGHRIVAKTLTGKNLDIVISPNHTVLDLKSFICDKEGIPPDQQRLFFESKQLEDDDCLYQVGIQKGSIVVLVLRLRGGARTKQTARLQTGGRAPNMGAAGPGVVQQRRSRRIARMPSRNYNETNRRVRRRLNEHVIE